MRSVTERGFWEAFRFSWLSSLAATQNASDTAHFGSCLRILCLLRHDWRLEMKLAQHIVLTLLLLATVSLPLSAQDASGRFTVAHETRWGTAVLPAGNYLVSLRSGPVPYVIVTSDAHNDVAIMAVGEYLDTSQCKTSSLVLQQNAGSWEVSSLCFASSLTLHFTTNHTAAVAPQVAAVSESK